MIQYNKHKEIRNKEVRVWGRGKIKNSILGMLRTDMKSMKIQRAKVDC